MQKKLLIGDLAKKFNINPKTIRYYEEIQLIPEPKRDYNNYRIYSEETTDRLDFIQKAKNYGLTLNEIKEILRTHENGSNTCEQVGEVVRRKRLEIENKIIMLKKLKKKLQNLENDCFDSKYCVENPDECICPNIAK